MSEPIITIDHIEVFQPSNTRYKGWIDQPKSKAQLHDLDFNIMGWVFGENIKQILAFNGGTVINIGVCNIERPDVKALFQWVPQIDQMTPGFALHIRSLRLSDQFKIRIVIELESGEWIDFAVIHGHKTAPQFDTQAWMQLKPLFLNAFGRSGTTWMMHLLAHHPELVVAGDYPYEVLQAPYWANLFEVLTATQARYNMQFHQQDHYISYYNIKHLHHRNIFRAWDVMVQAETKHTPVDGMSFQDWMKGSFIQSTLEFCIQSLDRYYQRFKTIINRENAIYFVEKGFYNLLLLRTLMPYRREIVLVRDIRDMYCSIHAFNAKRNVIGFNVNGFPNEREFIRYLVEIYRENLQLLHRDPEHTHLIQYEKLIRQPQTTLQSAFAFLEIAADDATIEHILQQASQDTKEQQYHRTTSSSEASIGRWRHDLSDTAKALFEELAPDVLVAFDYEVR